MVRVELTRRAMIDLQDIVDYSIKSFGQITADQYVDDIESALLMIQEQPGLLSSKKDISAFFQFYSVRKHQLVCTRSEDIIIVLTIKHCQMSFPERLQELEPNLLQEAELLYKRLFQAENNG